MRRITAQTKFNSTNVNSNSNCRIITNFTAAFINAEMKSILPT